MMAALSVLICLDAAGKACVVHFPVFATVWSRYFGHMIVVMLFGLTMARGALWQTEHLPQQLARGTLLAVMTVFYFAAMRTLSLAHATAILFATPILVTVWARLWLKEEVGGVRWASVGLGFLGVLIICRPGGGLDPQGVGLALCAALCNSFYQIITRKRAATDSPGAQLFYAGLVGAMGLSIALPLWWQPVRVAAIDWVVFASIGVFGALGHWLLIKAYTIAPAPVLASWMYVQLVFSVLLGWAVFGDMPGLSALLGMALIAIAPQIPYFVRSKKSEANA